MGTVSSHTSSSSSSTSSQPVVFPTREVHSAASLPIKSEPVPSDHGKVIPSTPGSPITKSPSQSNPPASDTQSKESIEIHESIPEDDGYRWRKYGRKNVKGNQFPRSYYKCTHPACQVKKQVETVIENDKPVMHTTYKGEHNHEPPQVTRLNAQDQASFKNSVLSEFLGTDAEPPKVKVPQCVRPAGGPSSANPRLVVETSSGVDYLDDGYHWRKYGQKNVKGSPFPRSYYKCTEKNCPVKKQVEQCGPLGGTIINTYEGTHNHLAPGLEENPRKRRRRRKSSPGMSPSQSHLSSSLGEYCDHDDSVSGKRRKYRIETEEEDRGEAGAELRADAPQNILSANDSSLPTALPLHLRFSSNNKLSAHLRQFPPLGSPATSPFGMGLGISLANSDESVFAAPSPSLASTLAPLSSSVTSPLSRPIPAISTSPSFPPQESMESAEGQEKGAFLLPGISSAFKSSDSYPTTSPPFLASSAITYASVPIHEHRQGTKTIFAPSSSTHAP